MPDQRIPHAPANCCVDPNEDDEIVQGAVMTQVLCLHPAHLTADELTREMIGAANDFASRDRVDRAVRDLIRSSLLHRHGDFVLPTRAAVRFNELREAGS